MARHRDHSAFDLDGLAADLRRDGGRERLSDDARRRLFGSVTETAAAGALSGLFLPFRRLALAAVLPMLVLGVLLISVADRQPVELGTDEPRIAAQKVGGEVVFNIANGGQAHRVVRSASPEGVGNAVSVQGEFRDRLANGVGIVYYRID